MLSNPAPMQLLGPHGTQTPAARLPWQQKSS